MGLLQRIYRAHTGEMVGQPVGDQAGRLPEDSNADQPPRHRVRTRHASPIVPRGCVVFGDTVHFFDSKCRSPLWADPRFHATALLVFLRDMWPCHWMSAHDIERIAYPAMCSEFNT